MSFQGWNHSAVARFLAAAVFSGTHPAPDLKSVHFRRWEAESLTDGGQSAFQPMALPHLSP
jgi:hypothetical protein